MKKHVSLHPELNSRYFCIQCDNCFDDKNDFECHMKMEHITQDEQINIPYETRIRDGELDSKEDLKNHYKVHHLQSLRN